MEELKKMLMEFDSDEQISETFICCICRDLLYKPVVLGCGHVSCFWCVHKSMSASQKSQCPVCRNIYFHFPYVCQTLHFLLFKLHPNAYKRRESQTLEEENETGNYAPRLGSAACSLQSEEIVVQRAGYLQTKVANLINGTGETSAKMCIVESNLAQHGEDIDSVYHDPKQIVSVGDVLCGSCKHVLYRPIVLNCGHAFCICCVVRDAHEMLKCEVCQCPHPGDFPKVCLEFDKFLEKQFPVEYKLRSDNVKQEQMSSIVSAGSGISCTSQSSGHNPLFDGASVVHSGVGCDSCGMTPIVGDRYRCKDCKEKIGCDLCGDCFARRSIFPGRFNQQHTPDHEFDVLLTNDVSFHVLEDITEIVNILDSASIDFLALADIMREITDRDVSRFAEINEDMGAPLPSSERQENGSSDETSNETLL